MKNLHKFLSQYSNCPLCNKDIFTEMMISFKAFTKRTAAPYILPLNYVRDMDSKACFKYIKHREDDTRSYDPGFDRASNNFVVSCDGSFMFDSNVFPPDSYVIFGYCPEDHFVIETKDVYINSIEDINKKIRLSKEEIEIKNYRIVNDYDFKTTRIYVDNSFPAKLITKLSKSYSIKNNSPSDIVSKIESLLTLV